MIAKIYPVKRMPRRFGAFDYLLPDDVQVERGDLVQIPFRQSTILGVVKETRTRKPHGFELKNVKQKYQNISLTDQEVGFFEDTAFDLAQSVPSILHATIPDIPKRTSKPAEIQNPQTLTLPNREVQSISHIVHECRKRRRAFVCVSDIRRMSAVVAGYAAKQEDDNMAIILPNTRDAKLVAQHLAYLNPVLVTSEETNNMRFAAWKRFRDNDSRILIGTRLGILQTHPDISAYFILKSSHRNHRQWDRNPRYDSRISAWDLHEVMHAKLFFMDVESRADDLKLFGSTNRLTLFQKTTPEIFQMNKERPTAPHPALSSRTMQKISDVLEKGGRVLCCYNQKGRSNKLRCRDCGHIFSCEHCGGPMVVYEQTLRCHRCKQRYTLPTNCPNCNGKELQPRGFGNQSIKDALKELLPGKDVVICDKEHQNIDDLPAADVLVVTTYYTENIFNPFDPPDIDLVVQLNADTPLYEPTFRAKEHTIIDFERWRGLAHACGSAFIAQTDQKEIFTSFFDHPESTWKEELEMREAYHQPPTRRWFSIHYRDKEKRKSELAIHKVLKDIKSRFPEAIVYGPKKAKRPGLEIEVGLQPKHVQEMLEICGNLKDSYIIDTHAFF